MKVVVILTSDGLRKLVAEQGLFEVDPYKQYVVLRSSLKLFSNGSKCQSQIVTWGDKHKEK